MSNELEYPDSNKERSKINSTKHNDNENRILPDFNDLGEF
jgi:hypothetical protein